MGMGNRADVPPFPNEGQLCPNVFAAFLKFIVEKFRFNEFSSTEPHPRRTARIARSLLPFTLNMFGSLPQGASLIHGQPIPSRMPSFFAPFTRRMPAASSGLKSPVSAAS